jgi:microcystin degradation protein MlrC
MRKTFFPLMFVIVCIAMVGCSKKSDQFAKLPRIAIAGLAIESSTFSPALTHEEAFHAKVGDTIMSSYRFFARDSGEYKRAQWFPVLIGRALPGGIVTREAYESLMKKMLEGLK